MATPSRSTLATTLDTYETAKNQSRLNPTVQTVIKDVWGFSTLRPMQAEAIEAGLSNRDSLVVLPTGGGKSLCYQVPPLVANRLDVVVSPLISLMKDQVDALQSNGYPAAAIYSGLSNDERATIEQQTRAGELKLLFVAPERLMSASFLNFLKSSGVANFAIDEAHCISHWGHDFRPEYRRLAELRKRFPHATFHAFTATASKQVRHDIVEQLQLRNPCLLVGNFDRPNLVYRMVPRVDNNQQILEIIRRHDHEAVIVYCISRKDTEHLADFLRLNRIKAKAYHAGKTAAERRRFQDAFARERLDVITATVAFGMGIDRSNVRCVIHAAMPKSIEHYQQETGRAGRDGLEAECVLLYSQSDIVRWERLIAMSAEEADRPEAVITAANALLKKMQRLASNATCRHRALVEYFGQQYNHSSCDACDVCLREIDVINDSTTVAQKIISCVARVDQRFGVGHIADVLIGSSSESVIRNGHDSLSVYGLLAPMSKKEVVNLTHQLIDQNWLSRTTGDQPVVVLNERSAQVLRRECEVKLVKPAHRTKRTRHDAESWEGVDRDLFEELRAVRREIAEEHAVPAFVIFSDATLRDLARHRPSSLNSMRRIYGIGARKLENFGDLFLQVIFDFCEKHRLGMDTAPTN